MPLEYEAIRKSFDQAAKNYEKNAVLQKEVLSRLLERLADEKHIDQQLDPKHILDLGCGTAWAASGLVQLCSNARITGIDFSKNMLQQASTHKALKTLHADVHDLPLADESCDVVFSNMLLHWSNEQEVFNECMRVLKPGGLLLMSCLGETSLFELQHICDTVKGGFHVHSFPALHDLGDLLLKGGFAEVVVNAEVITLTYEEIVSLMKDIKASGGQYVDENRSKGLVSRDYFSRFQSEYEAYRQDGKLPASYEIVYLRAKKPEANGDIKLKISG